MLVVLLVTLYLLLVGVFVVVQNPIRKVNLSLAASIVVTGSWALGVYGLQSEIGESLLYARAIFMLGLMSIVTLLWFITELLADLKIKTLPRWFTLSYYGAAAVLALATLATPLVVEEIVKTGNQLPIPEYGALIPLYAIMLIVSIITIVSLLSRGYAGARGLVKAQIGAVAITILASVCIAVMTNFVLPLLVGSSQTALLVPLPVLVLLSGLSYLIVKQQLFRAGTYILRAVTYFIVTALLVAVVIIPLLSGINLLSNTRMTDTGFTALVLTMTLIAISYSYISNWFSRATVRIFFRDTYDPAEVLGELNKILVSTGELEAMLRGSLSLINQALKNETAAFILLDSVSDRPRVIKFGKVSYSTADIDNIKKLIGATNKNTVLTEMLPIATDSLRTLLHEKHAGVVLRIMTGRGGHKKDLGYLVLGERKSGKPYDYRDVNFLETIVNTIAIAVQNALHYEETQHFNETLRNKVEEATAELKATNKHLKQLDQTKDEFVSLTSHQLRTPLTTVKGYISMLLDGDAGELEPQQRKLLEEAFNSSQRMVHLIGDFLNVSRIQTGKFEIELSDVNLAEILDEEIEQQRTSATSRQLTLVYDKPEHFPIMQLDEDKIRQVMMNFVDNAIYYSPAGSSINIVLSATTDTVEFKVIDQGIGVPADEQHKLFTKFARASNAKKQRPDGTGIGLFMAKKVIVALGGSIIFQSKEGKGSTFGFRLNRKT